MKFSRLLPLICQKMIWLPTRFALIFFGKLEVVGLDNLTNIENPVLFAVNHSSDIDPFMVPASLPFFSKFSPLFYVVREKSFYNDKGWKKQLFNPWFIHMWGGYEVKIDLKNYEIALEKHIKLLQEGNNFCIFPEGRITKDGKLQEGKGGISYLAHVRPCVIIPVAIIGVYKMSAYEFFGRKREIKIVYGEKIYSDDLYKLIPLQTSNENMWRREAAYIMKKISELMIKN